MFDGCDNLEKITNIEKLNWKCIKGGASKDDIFQDCRKLA